MNSAHYTLYSFLKCWYLSVQVYFLSVFSFFLFLSLHDVTKSCLWASTGLNICVPHIVFSSKHWLFLWRRYLAPQHWLATLPGGRIPTVSWWQYSISFLPSRKAKWLNPLYLLTSTYHKGYLSWLTQSDTPFGILNLKLGESKSIWAGVRWLWWRCVDRLLMMPIQRRLLDFCPLCKPETFCSILPVM